MSLKIKVYSDYVCPFCIIAKKPFEEAIKGKDVEIEWMPFELRPEGQPKLDPINDASKLYLWDKSIRPISKSLDMNLDIPKVSPHPYTNLAFEAFHFAKEYKKENEFNDRVFKAFFYESQDIGDMNVIAQLAYEVGLDKDLCLDALKNRKYKKIQQDYLEHAYNEEINVVPTFMIGDSRLEGVNSKEDFEYVINKEMNK